MPWFFDFSVRDHQKFFPLTPLHSCRQKSQKHISEKPLRINVILRFNQYHCMTVPEWNWYLQQHYHVGSIAIRQAVELVNSLPPVFYAHHPSFPDIHELNDSTDCYIPYRSIIFFPEKWSLFTNSVKYSPPDQIVLFPKQENTEYHTPSEGS